MTGLAWSLAIYGFAIALSATVATAQQQPPAIAPTDTEYGNKGQQTGPYQGQSVPTTAVTDPGFNTSDDVGNAHSQSWISSNFHWVIILVVCLIVLAALIYYITRSIRGVRKQLQKGHQDALPLQHRHNYSAPYEQHLNESIHPPPMYSYEPPKYEQAVRY
ncbi:hypothetical protein Unana1_05883 [Umbelopsis nana]